ncbi:hypothetical protein QF026_005638 [Streptomyces aurantiacus]|nr:hypothetical protein [Streptomyces aurantiacus]
MELRRSVITEEPCHRASIMAGRTAFTGTGGAGVLALHTDPRRALLQVTGLVDDRDDDVDAEVVDYEAAQVVADGDPGQPTDDAVIV